MNTRLLYAASQSLNEQSKKWIVGMDNDFISILCVKNILPPVPGWIGSHYTEQIFF